MNDKRLGCLSVICAVLVFASGCFPGRGDHVLDTWEASNGTLKVRIRKFDEKHNILQHNYFAFEAAAAGSDQWREILTWRADEGFPIRHDWVQIVSPQVVCAFALAKYAVTTDAGHTWSEWDAAKMVPNLPSPLQTWIKEAHVSADGSGTMLLSSSPALFQLNTTDYGVHWAPVK